MALPAVSAENGQAALIERLGNTRATNLGAILNDQFSGVPPAHGFTVADPYDDKATASVNAWFENPDRNLSVCAIRFLDAQQVDYELRNFDSPAAAADSGFLVTHYGRCGSCSTLRDLAVYLSRPDLTSPAQQCARKTGLSRKKDCFMKTLGLTESCAESWAYNARNTRRACLGACIADYGLFNLLFNRFPGDPTDASGNLRPCLQCDEDHSGPGFQYSAGRTRRNSGIASAIQRRDGENRPVDHSCYFSD